MESSVFCDETPCFLMKVTGMLVASFGRFLVLLFYPEEGGDAFL
jgi:hypothetical protein